MNTSVANVAAIILLVIFGVATYLLLRQVSAPDDTWNRYIYIYGAIEALTFAAAGYLFGKEVNRQRAESAEEDANENKQAAQNGALLAEAVRNSKANQVNLENARLLTTKDTTPILEHLESRANQLFPS